MRHPIPVALACLGLLVAGTFTRYPQAGAAPQKHGDVLVFARQAEGAAAELSIAGARSGQVLFEQPMPPSQKGTLNTVDLVASPATRLVYGILENASGAVVTIDPATGVASTFFRLPNGDFAGQLALSADGATLYVGGESDDYVLDAASGSLEATAPGVGGFPLGYHLLAAAPGGRHVYALSGSGYTVLDAKTFQFESQVDIGDSPLAAAVSANGKLLFLAGYSGKLEVVNLATRKVVRISPLGNTPADLVLDRASQVLYVAAGEQITVIDANSYATLHEIGGIGVPFDLAVDPTTHACLAATSSGLWRIDPATFKTKQLERAGAATVQGVSETY